MKHDAEYIPEEWVMVKITGTDPHYRIFGSWRGGYAYGDSWKLNSGVVKVEEDDDFYLFHGHSGSRYLCSKKRYGIGSPYNYGVIGHYCENSDGKMFVIEDMPDNISEMDWIIS
jgi:hypothetical protein